jgi:predicted O-linked N-acetylglucosamine transferase (SPINDLY family)
MVDHWRSLIGLTDKAVAALVRNDRIDVLVDLAGHTAGNRLSAFAEKPAPIQVSWLGYPATTGISAIDYRFTDDIADPPGATERFHTETLWRLSGGFLCYTAPREAPPVSPSPCGTGQPLTFGSFNNLAKVNRAVIEAWAGLLSAVAGSRLLLKSKALRSADVQQRVWEVFAGRGIARERIMFEGWAEGLAAHLALYGKVDIALDTFPYNGTTTTFEALWMGVPVICLAGDRHSARVGASILTRCGLSNFIAASLDDYRAKATALARDPPALGDMRQALRPRVASSPLCDGKAFAAQIEDAYRTFVARAAAAS